jgi:hypothetical protein
MTRCKRCGGENPADARFCIDCGAALVEATTGPTTKLAGVPCPTCGASNPENARFCVVCGRGLAQGAPPKPRPTAPHPSARQSYPRTAAPPTWVPARTAPPRPPRPHVRGGSPGNWVFLIGLFVLLSYGNIWPGVLVLLGISMLLNQLAAGRIDKGLTALLWLGGLALLLSSGMLFPGIFVLLFLHAMLSGWGGPRGWHW